MDFYRTESIRSFVVRLLTRHAGELEPLFRQYGIPYARAAGTESAALVLGPSADRRKVEEILVGYEEAKGL
jgi:hypothetical protein